MKSSRVKRFGTVAFILVLITIAVSYISLSGPQNIYAEATNNDSRIIISDDLVNKLVTGVTNNDSRIIPFNDLIKKLVTGVTNNDSRIIPFNDLIKKLVTEVTNNDSKDHSIQ